MIEVPWGVWSSQLAGLEACRPRVGCRTSTGRGRYWVDIPGDNERRYYSGLRIDGQRIVGMQVGFHDLVDANLELKTDEPRNLMALNLLII